jgi:hypothetical protein
MSSDHSKRVKHSVFIRNNSPESDSSSQDSGDDEVYVESAKRKGKTLESSSAATDVCIIYIHFLFSVILILISRMMGKLRHIILQNILTNV